MKTVWLSVTANLYVLTASLILSIVQQKYEAFASGILAFTSLIAYLAGARLLPHPLHLASILILSIQGPYGFMLAVPLAPLYPLVAVSGGGVKPRPPLGRSSTAIVAFLAAVAPPSFLSISSLIVYMVTVLSLASAIAVSSLMLSRATVRLPMRIEAALGKEALLLVEIASPIAAKFWVEVEGGKLTEGYVKGRAYAKIRFRVLHIGATRLTIKIFLEDSMGYVVLTFGPYTVETVGVPTSSQVAAALEGLVAELPGLEAVRILRVRARRPGGAGGGEGLFGAFGQGWGRVGPWRGEYHGVRPYVAGDRLRDIHWKKTLSKRSLHVKEYEYGGEAELGARQVAEAAIIADLVASSPQELDELALTVYAALASAKPRSRIAFFARLPWGDTLEVMGPIEAILKLWHEIVLSGKLFTHYHYNSYGIASRLDAPPQEVPKPLAAIMEALSTWADLVVSSLYSLNVRRGARVVIIYGKPTETLNTYVQKKLLEEGFKPLRQRVRMDITKLTEKVRTFASHYYV